MHLGFFDFYQLEVCGLNGYSLVILSLLGLVISVIPFMIRVSHSTFSNLWAFMAWFSQLVY